MHCCIKNLLGMGSCSQKPRPQLRKLKNYFFTTLCSTVILSGRDIIGKKNQIYQIFTRC